MDKTFEYSPLFLGSGKLPSQIVGESDNGVGLNLSSMGSLWRRCKGEGVMNTQNFDIVVVTPAMPEKDPDTADQTTLTLPNVLAFKITHTEDERLTHIELLLESTMTGRVMMMSNTSNLFIRSDNKSDIDHRDDFNISITPPCLPSSPHEPLGLRLSLCSDFHCEEVALLPQLAIRYPAALCLWDMPYPSRLMSVHQDLVQRLRLAISPGEITLMRLVGRTVGKTLPTHGWNTKTNSANNTFNVTSKIFLNASCFSGVVLGRIGISPGTAKNDKQEELPSITQRQSLIFLVTSEMTAVLRALRWFANLFFPLRVGIREASEGERQPEDKGRSNLGEITDECIEPLHVVDLRGIDLGDMESYDLTMMPKQRPSGSLLFTAESVYNRSDVINSVGSIVQSFMSWAPFMLGWDKRTGLCYARRLDHNLPIPQTGMKYHHSLSTQLLQSSSPVIRDSESKVGLFSPRRQRSGSWITGRTKGYRSGIDIAIISIPVCRLESELLSKVLGTTNRTQSCPITMSSGLDTSQFPWEVYARSSFVSTVLGNIRRFLHIILASFVSTLFLLVSLVSSIL